MGQKVLGYRLRPETISSLFADLSSTSHFRLCSAIVHFYPKRLPFLSANADRRKR